MLTKQKKRGFIMTRLKNNYEVVHEFFYCANPETANNDYTFSTQCSFGTSFSDEENTILNFYSYYTKVAMLYKSPKDNNTYLLINWSSMTPTTGKHLSHLRSANPYYISISVPFIYGEHSTSLREIINQLIKHIQAFYYDKECLYKKEHRDFFEEVNNSFRDIEFYIGLDNDDMQYIDMLDDIETFLNQDTFIQKKKEAAAKKAAETRAKKARIEAQKKEILEKYSYMECIKACFYNENIEKENKILIRSTILQNGFSYVWFNDDNLTVSTSQHITVKRDDVIKLLRLWQHKKLRHGMTIDRYTVLEVMEDYVKIGCHKIPTENIQALINELDNETIAA